MVAAPVVHAIAIAELLGRSRLILVTNLTGIVVAFMISVSIAVPVMIAVMVPVSVVISIPVMIVVSVLILSAVIAAIIATAGVSAVIATIVAVIESLPVIALAIQISDFRVTGMAILRIILPVLEAGAKRSAVVSISLRVEVPVLG